MTSEELRREILRLIAEYYKVTFEEQKKFVPLKTRISYGGRFFDENEISNLVDASLDFWLTYGRYSRDFEKTFADFLGVEFALIVNSGSSANLLAFNALTSPLLGERRIRRGDEVITVAAGFPTTIAPIIQYGAVPVFVDVESETANIDTTLLDAAYSPRTKAVMLAHTLGNPFRIDVVKRFCDARKLWLIEDNCDALGSKYMGRLTGTWGDIGTSSFYPPHHITMGEGGAVYTNNPLLKKIMLSMRDWGRDCWCESGHDNTCGCRFSRQFGRLPVGYDHKYVYSHFGFNLKPTEMQAAIGCAQLGKLPEIIARRRENFKYLRDALMDFPYLEIIQCYPESEPSWFGFLMTIKDNAPFSRNDLARHLEKCGIQTRNLFAGNIVRHPCFETLRDGMDYRIVGSLSNTDRIMERSLWIGVYPGMTRDKLDFMAKSIKTLTIKR